MDGGPWRWAGMAARVTVGTGMWQSVRALCLI
ncbi:hypothetical protein B0E54_04034 [Micromonospora sp. MH99]|nr:hypothetical protein [Micromonospora sp. MH99]